MEFNLKGKIEKRTSKAGKEYEVLVVSYKEFKTDIYLDEHGSQLLHLVISMDKTTDPFKK